MATAVALALHGEGKPLHAAACTDCYKKLAAGSPDEDKTAYLETNFSLSYCMEGAVMKNTLAIALLVVALSPAAALAQPFCEYPARWVWRGYWSCEYPAPTYYYPRAYYPYGYYYPYGGAYLGWRGNYGGGHWHGGHSSGGHAGGGHGGHHGGSRK